MRVMGIGIADYEPLSGKIDVFALRGWKPNCLGVARGHNPNPNTSSYHGR
jgi:hypothetical protein